MKLYKSLLAAAMLAVSSVALTSCDEDLAVPPMSVPQAPEGMKATMTIAEFKNKYWSSDNNYCTQVGQTDKGEDVILAGRIIASDEGGNIYQNVMLQDETGAVTIAVLTSANDGLKNLYTKYKVGEEMFINATGLYAGKYAGLFQIGTAGEYNGTPQTSKMAATEFLSHTYLNGLPDPSAITEITMTIPEILAATDEAAQKKYQSQLVRINDVSWIGGGTETWGVPASSSTAENRYLVDANGNRLLVRNSNKSDFVDAVLPAGHGNVVGVMSYFNGTWQFLFRSPSDCTDFGGESYAPQIEGNGTADEPYTVGAVLAGASGSGQWVTGYIVGWVEGQVLADGAHFTVPATVASNILLAADPAETNVGNCIPVQLVAKTDIRTALNLQDNAANLGKQVSIKGDLASYFGASGIKAPTLYVWGDKGDDNATVTPPDTPDTPTGTATFKKVTTVTSGKQYVMVVDGQVGTAIGASDAYGRLGMSAVTIANDQFSTDIVNAITITAVTGGYTLTDSYGRKLSMDSSHFTNFQLNAEGEVWTITPDNGAFKIANVLNSDCYIVRSGTFTNIAPSNIVQYPTYTLPELYEKVN